MCVLDDGVTLACDQSVTGGENVDEKVLLGAARMVDLERCPLEDLDSSNGTTFLRAARERFLDLSSSGLEAAGKWCPCSVVHDGG